MRNKHKKPLPAATAPPKQPPRTYSPCSHCRVLTPSFAASLLRPLPRPCASAAELHFPRSLPLRREASAKRPRTDARDEKAARPAARADDLKPPLPVLAYGLAAAPEDDERCVPEETWSPRTPEPLKPPAHGSVARTAMASAATAAQAAAAPVVEVKTECGTSPAGATASAATSGAKRKKLGASSDAEAVPHSSAPLPSVCTVPSA